MLLDIMAAVIPALICITLHELSHGLVACKLGDDTAKSRGRLTLNPVKHIDPMGLAMMVFFKVGWAKPVPVDMRKFKNPKRGMALTALAGPVSNVLISIVFLFLFGLLYIPFYYNGNDFTRQILYMVELTAYISLGLAIFNVLPVPPLDGSKVFFSLLSDDNYYKLMRYERYGMIILIALVATGVLGRPLSTAIGFFYDKLFIFADWGYRIVLRFM